MRNKNTIPSLGVDFGRVINDGSSHPSGDDTIFLGGTSAEAMQTPAMPGAFNVLKRLSEVFEGRIWIISKCGPKIQLRTEEWLGHHRFFEDTGIDSSHARFCRQRSEKAVHCKRLRITHFIDDRPDVLEQLQNIVQHLFLFGPQSGTIPPFVLHVPNWAIVERKVLESLANQSLSGE